MTTTDLTPADLVELAKGVGGTRCPCGNCCQWGFGQRAATTLDWLLTGDGMCWLLEWLVNAGFLYAVGRGNYASNRICCEIEKAVEKIHVAEFADTPPQAVALAALAVVRARKKQRK